MIAIKPFGGLQETPEELVQRCQEHIEWNDREMVDALKRQARGEDTARGRSSISRDGTRTVPSKMIENIGLSSTLKVK